jgi:hypothetical protein
MLPKGNFALDIDFYQEGGVLLGLSAAVFDRLSFGISYGGSKLIGGESPVMNSTPGMNIKIRVFEESALFPAIAIGFDSQGKDGFLRDVERYAVKSPGFYAVGSKNYSFLGFLSFHGGLNYSLESGDDERGLNAFAGIEKTIGPVISVVAEYNLAANDSNGRIGSGRGYLNAGLKWAIGGGLTLAVNLKDLAKNAEDVTVANRTVRIEYAKSF